MLTSTPSRPRPIGFSAPNCGPWSGRERMAPPGPRRPTAHLSTSPTPPTGTPRPTTCRRPSRPKHATAVASPARPSDARSICWRHCEQRQRRQRHRTRRRAGGQGPGRDRARRDRQETRPGTGSAGAPLRRPRPDRGSARSGQAPYGALIRQRHQPPVRSHPVHAGFDALGRDRRRHIRPAQRPVHLPTRPDLRQPAARGRDQSGAGEDPVRPAGGDAGASGNGRRNHAAPRAAVPRDRHAKPHRSRGHVRALRSPAGQVHSPHLRRPPRATSRDRDAGAPGCPPYRRRRVAGGPGPRHAALDADRDRGRLRLAQHLRLYRGHRCRPAVEPAGSGWGKSTRLVGASEAVALEGNYGRPRLRRSRGRQGRSRSGPGSPDHAQARGLGPAHPDGRSGPPGSRDGAHADCRRNGPAANLTLTTSPKLGAYAALGTAGLLVALVWSYPEAAVLGLPFIVAVLTALTLVERPQLLASIEVDRERLLEGEDVHLTVTVNSTTDIPWLQIAWPVPQRSEERRVG